MDPYIARMKQPNHNIYGVSSFVYKVIVALGIALWILLFFDVPIHYLPMSTQAAIWGVTLAVGILIAFMLGKTGKANIVPYSRKDDFEFLGLYDLKDSNLDNRHDVIKRDEEVRYMRQILEEIIFPQVSVKQALCITGSSGCGKSIIMNFFKQTYENEYQIFDFAGNYHEFDGHMVALFGTNMDVKISELTSGGKAVFILDQFERFFFLSHREQKRIQDIMRYLCKKTPA